MALLLRGDNLGKSFGIRTLFQGVSIGFDESERTGLIGPNGSGKSTLLRILAGLESPDDGSLTSRRNLRLGYLPQDERFPAGKTPRQILLDALADQPISDRDRLTRVEIQLSRSGFERPDEPAENLSGGWRKRLALAREMIREPELLLLDEPTNHLDLEGILELETILGRSPFAFVVVSHDRRFLENVANRIVELNSRYPDGFLSCRGRYSDFLERREEFLAGQSARQSALAGEVRREVEWLRRGAKARTTKAKGRIERAGKMMEELADLQTRGTDAGAAQIDFAATQRQTRKLLTVKDGAVRVGDRTLFRDLNLVLSPGMKLGLLGPNGSGKSTLIRLLAGQIAPESGSVWRADGLKIVLFDQGRRRLDPSQTLRRALFPAGDTMSWRGSPLHVSGWAKKFLFRPEQLDLPVGELSGGEQSRVLIASMMLEPADLLILDEPTNDLDIPSLEVLEESLSEFPGALVLVTHDRLMLDRLSTELIALDGKGAVRPYASVDQWRRARESADKTPTPAPKPAPARSARSASDRPRLTWAEQRELEGIERLILEAEEALQAGQKSMEDPLVLADHERLRAVCQEVDAASKRVQSLYDRWQELESRKG